MIEVDLPIYVNINVIEIGNESIHDDKDNWLQDNQQFSKEDMELTDRNSINVKTVLLKIASWDNFVNCIDANYKGDKA